MTKKPFKEDTTWPFPSNLPAKTMHGVERTDKDGNKYAKVTTKLLVLRKKKETTS